MNDERIKQVIEDHREELDRLASMMDDEIDLSDMPELTDEEWDRTIRGKYYKPVKQQLTLRPDADVVEWFKRTSPKYQTAINGALRKHMNEQRRKNK